ncbi:uncharacterized protein DI49_1145 [Saccharomyces eubayanus]|uniref:uncharacterized protein n=1 Tax=Saccharomyces eubayanus TaxID=1080349 RepID=UPI0006C54CC1|nr:hypothetical protein DI49_1145 [Saccharomyces eubayanus]KOH00434.1 hypothetical protein DI49_1145 [Saccharomyces eubayanus]
MQHSIEIALACHGMPCYAVLCRVASSRVASSRTGPYSTVLQSDPSSPVSYRTVTVSALADFSLALPSAPHPSLSPIVATPVASHQTFSHVLYSIFFWRLPLSGFNKVFFVLFFFSSVGWSFFPFRLSKQKRIFFLFLVFFVFCFFANNVRSSIGRARNNKANKTTSVISEPDAHYYHLFSLSLSLSPPLL